MRKALLIGLLLLGAGSTACDLTGPKLSEDPNNPSAANPISLFVAAQVNTFVLSESDIARTTCVWLQACAGRNSQYLGIDNYTAIGDGDFWFTSWAVTYGGGGLIDLRRIETVPDSTLAGISRVMEAWLIGTAADVWGDIPYSQAANPAIKAPQLDPQQQVYAGVQAKLDTAIALLANAAPASPALRAGDLVYHGNKARWSRLANTLKARFYMHTAEMVPLAYDSVLKYAPLGILPGQDYENFHATDLSSSNIWYQFLLSAAKDYVAAGAFGVDLLQNAGDPRLTEYYSPTQLGGIFVGGQPGGGDGLDPSTISSLSATRLAPDFQQPLVTWAEGQLLISEAQFQTGDEAGALATLEGVRAEAGLAPLAPAPLGQALLLAIMTEKYIREFQNIEAWSDYRRTCLPALTGPNGQAIPRRLPYPLTERSANPSIPGPGPVANWNDPNACP